MLEKLKLYIKTMQSKNFTYKKRQIDIPLNSWKIISLIGVRRVGKSFLLYQLIDELKQKWVKKEQILFFSFEDDRFEFVQENLDLILQAYKELYPEQDFQNVYVFFDEIQDVDWWEKFVRRIYDFETKNIFITGSSAKLLSKEIATALRGRSLSYEIYPLSFSEYLSFKDIEVDLYLEQSILKVKNEFWNYLEWSFPEIVFLDTDLRYRVYKEYLDVMIFRDLIQRYEIKNDKALYYFIKRMLSNVAKEFSVNKIFNELKSNWLKISKEYLYTWLKYLEDIYLIFVNEKFSSSIPKKEFSIKKAYAIDNWFVNLFTFSDIGRKLENLVYIELKRRWNEIYYHKNRKECDFIVWGQKRDLRSEEGFEAGREMLKESFENKWWEKVFLSLNWDLLPIQVTYSLEDEQTKEREIAWLVEAMKMYWLKEGLILHMMKKMRFIWKMI